MIIEQRDSTLTKPALGVEAIPTGVDGASTPSTYGDVTIDNVTLSAVYNRYLVNMLAPIDAVTVNNLSETVLDLTEWPYVDRLMEGYGTVELVNGGVKQRFSLNCNDVSGGGTENRVTGFSSSTLGAHTWAILEPLLIAGGDDVCLSGGVLSGSNWDFGAATYNAACWAADFDFSGVSHKNSWWNISSPCGTAITERHVVMAAHYTPPAGTVLTFIAPDGTKVTRTILAYNAGTITGNSGKLNDNPVVGDVAIATLSGPNLSDDGITIYPIAGDWIHKDMGGGSFAAQWLGVKLTQTRKVALCGRTDTSATTPLLVSGTYNGTTFTDKKVAHVTDWGSAMENFLPYFLRSYAARMAANIVGESGHPRFIPLTSTALALAGCVTASNGGGPYPDEDIWNACIASADTAAGISTGYTVTVAPDPTL